MQRLLSGVLKYDGEKIIIGAQDQGLLTNKFEKIARKLWNNKDRFFYTEKDRYKWKYVG